VVKIRLRHLLLGLFILLVYANIAYAANSRLSFSNVDVKIGSKTIRNLQNGNSIPEVTRPDRQVEFRVEARNNFSSSDNVRISDITVRTTIENIDNGNDMKQESDRFDLRADTETKKIFTFDIPLEVREDTYNVLIEAEGQDENGTIESAEMRLKLEVIKDNHLLKIIKDTLIPAEVSCNRNNIQLSTAILNIGNDDEDSVSVRIQNSDLGIDINDQIGNIKARPNEPESKFSKVYTFKIPENAEAGSYPINLKLSYNNDRQVTSDSPILKIKDCAGKSAGANGKPKNTDGNKVELITPAAANTATAKPSEIPPGTIITQENLLQGNVFFIALIFVVVLAVITIIVLVAMSRKRS